MSFLKDCAKTFANCFAAGSGQMIGMAAGRIGIGVVGLAITEVVNKAKSPTVKLSNKPYHRMTFTQSEKKI